PAATSTPPAQIPPIDEALARSAIRARQILLDPIIGNSIFPSGISHEDTISKIRAALKTSIPPSSNDPHASIKALLQLRNGGLIIELDSEHTVHKLKDHTTRKTFLHALENSVLFKDRTYTLVVQYIPVNLLIECPGLLRLIEKKNHLENEALVSMRWIKPPHKR
ncbi:hypothetical protein CY34DRAFT_29868, partial [Suillus luteus UH-Slu-Lm8-n1]